MELKEWTYEEFPEFTDEVSGAKWIDTTGDEPGVFYLSDIEYAAADGTTLHLQIQIPNSRNCPFDPLIEKQAFAYPCVVYVQGSAWMEQYVYGNVPQLARLSERGYVTAIVEYRHSGIASFPAQAKDARNAIRFLRANAERFGIDPQRIAVSGSSSGGHTALWAVLLNSEDTRSSQYPGVSADVKAVISYFGSSSAMGDDNYPSTVNYLQPDSPEGMVMGGVDLRDRPDLRKKLSVECNIDVSTEIPPVLMFHGTKDRTVNTKVSVKVFNRLKECGKDVDLYFLKGADHGGPEFWTPEVIDIVDEFLKKNLA